MLLVNSLCDFLKSSGIGPMSQDLEPSNVALKYR
jgi:hypothetical protein